MRRLLITLAAGLIACAGLAEPSMNYRDIPLGTNTSGSATMPLSGYVEAVYVSVSDGASTGTVTVSYAPHAGGTAVNIATNSVTDEKVWRPTVDRTDVAGADLTSDEPSRFALAGETVTFSVASSPTGLTWKCVVVTNED